LSITVVKNCLLLLCGAFSSELLAQDIRLQLREKVEVELEEVFVEDVASCFSSNAGLCVEVLGVVLRQAPHPGQKVIVNRQTIKDAIAEEFRDINIIITDAQKITVRSKFHLLDASSVLKSFEAWLSRLTPAHDIRIKPIRARPVGRIYSRSPGQQIDFLVNGKKLKSVRSLFEAINNGWSNFSLKIGSEIQGQTASNQRVMVQVLLESKVPVAKRRLSAGRIVARNDLGESWIKKKLFQLHSRVISPKDILNKEVIRTVNANSPFKKKWLRAPRLVHRGDQVRIKMVVGGMIFEKEWESLSDGAAGDKIEILDKKNGKKSHATVTGTKKARAVL
jgi:flagella basal body P-ring formation protein FlgA